METSDLPVIYPQAESSLQDSFRTHIHQDVFMILSDFLTQRERDFKAFKEVWHRLDFQLIHVSKPDEIAYEWFMDALFDECLETIMEYFNIDTGMVMGALYLLFCLYQSQVGHQKISVSKRVWTHLVAIDKACLEDESLTEGHKILGVLVSLKAFTFVALTPREISEAHRKNNERLLEERGNPADISKQIEVDLDSLECNIVRAPESLFETSFDLQNIEESFFDEKEKLSSRYADPGFVKSGLSRDLAQVQRDWAATFGAVDVYARRNTAVLPVGFKSGNNGAAGYKARRATLQEPFQRPQTAPLPTTSEPPEYMISAEHMPSLF